MVRINDVSIVNVDGVCIAKWTLRYGFDVARIYKFLNSQRASANAFSAIHGFFNERVAVFCCSAGY